MKTKRMKLSVLIRAITIFALVVSIFSSFPVSTVFAEAGYALEFDGVSEYVKLGDTGNLMGGDIWASSKTVSLWVRPDAPTSPATRPEGGVFLVGNDRPRFFGITRATWEGADRLWVWNYDSNGTDMIGIDFVPGEWLQIALVHSGGVLSAYKNGVLVGSVASGTTVMPNGTGDGNLYIGGSDNSRTVKFAGQIDEVRLWNVGLDGATVLNWAYTEVTEAHPNWANLMAYYQMSDGAGLTLTDNSAYSNTGSLLGGMADANWVISGAFGGSSNTPPVADGQAVVLDEDSAAAITLSGSDADGDPLAYSLVSPASHGVVSGTAPNLSYTPQANYHGLDSFSFKVNDGMIDSAPAQVDVTILPVNDAPVAVDDSATANAGVEITIEVLSNDSDVDGDALVVSAVGSTANGVVVNNGNNISYTPDVSFTGEDAFSYTVGDGQGGTATGQVTVTVYPANDPPVAVDDAASTDEDAGVVINVLLNDSDVNGDALTISGVSAASHGAVVNNGLDVSYTPQANYHGSDAFSYTITDGRGGTATAQVAVTVNPVNDAPVAVDDAASTSEGVEVVVDVLGNDSDVDGDLLVVSGVGSALNGVVANNGSSVSYTPEAGYLGSDSFSYTIADGQGGSGTAQVVVTVNPASTGAGYALEFDGVSDYVKLGDTGNLMGGDIWASSKTVSLWVRPDAPTSPATRPEGGVFLVGNDRPRFFGITRATWEGADRIWVWNYDSNGTDMIGIDFVPGEWLQIALVHSGGVLSGYKNGVLVGSVASGTTVMPNGTGDGNLYIGGSDNSRTVKFAGQIDEVRLWNVGLDGATVLNWAYTEVTEAHPNWANLMAYYQMSDGAGLTLTDNSAYSNTGSLLGGMADANWVISGAFGGG